MLFYSFHRHDLPLQSTLFIIIIIIIITVV